MRWKITVEYDGAEFCGWQRQKDDVTVQGTLEDAIFAFSGERVTLHVAGRTDAGVHAYANVAHFDLERETTAPIVRDALNALVRPRRVSVLKAELVSQEFHARFNALARSYEYHVINRRAPTALMIGRAWHVARPLDLPVMQACAEVLIGHHDFSTFRALGCQAKSPLKTLDFFDIECSRDGEATMFRYTVRARSFLYHQVRNMVGTLTLVGGGQWSIDDFKSAFLAQDRSKGGPTAPPQGLFFKNVLYPGLASEAKPSEDTMSEF